MISLEEYLVLEDDAPAKRQMRPDRKSLDYNALYQSLCKGFAKPNPLAAMTCHRDTHSSERTPEPLPAIDAPAGGFPVAPMAHKFGGWGA
jgi:hypothetical protein